MARNAAAIQSDLDAAYAGRVAVLSGAQSYSMDSGQSKKTVTRASLKEINNTIDQLNRELEDAIDGGASDCVTPLFQRFP